MARIVTSLPVTEYPVAAGNYDTNRKPINTIILHTMVGYKVGTRVHFNTPRKGSPSSAHYGVNMDGSIDHFLEETFTAYHCGNYEVNLQSIGIECEDLGNPNVTRTDQLYESVSRLVADICQYYTIPVNREHIKKHTEVSVAYTPCPHSLDIDRIITRAREILGQETTPSIKVIVTSTTGLRIRSKSTTMSASQGVVKKGTVITAEQIVEGENINGNNLWVQLKGQMAFIWAGGTDYSAPAKNIGGVADPGADKEQALLRLTNIRNEIKASTLIETVNILSEAYAKNNKGLLDKLLGR